ncbi:MAG: hypothetical protein UT32_C0001G0083 [Parcubacteria group bacterium GW2011_GWC2_39_14]|nr:MAG: hypothetical protein UT32_C0001G0083 [Parcubacteria group bacterium GW2011_GWC2_39_14]KKR55507.1 MAG: hypothetical protein UT91_C0001G0082 [Parcubacteria group bacterium GW2011_GWA2_40_23]
MLGRIILGLILCVVGYFFVWKPLTFLDLIGPIPFAEKWFGNSVSFYKFVGVFIIMIGFLAITNLHGRVLEWLVGFIAR